MGIPNTWCEILKQQCRLCHLCKNSNRSEEHMWYKHNVYIYSYKKIWQEIKEYHDIQVANHAKKKTITKLKRKVFLDYRNPLLKQAKEDTEKLFDKIYRKDQDITEDAAQNNENEEKLKPK